MSFLDPGFSATVTWLGCVGDRESSLRSAERRDLLVSFSGIEGESHSGLTRPACVRVEALYETGTEIRNTRQITIVSDEELRIIAAKMGLDRIDPGLLGANIVVRGIPALTLVPPGSRLQFGQGATVTVDMENLPCNLPAREIEAEAPGFGKRFKAAAANRRGVTAWVEREGVIRHGEEVRLLVPAQPNWPHAAGGANGDPGVAAQG